jgi:hypothetical protein
MLKALSGYQYSPRVGTRKKSESKVGNGTVFVSVTSGNFKERRLILGCRNLKCRLLSQ